MQTVLVSVTDKTNLDSFLKQLEKFDQLRIIATTSTAQYLQEHGFTCTKVEELTGFPEILAGRVKTLHPRVFAGILSRPSKEDRSCLAEMDISEIDMVVVNLYAFEQKLNKGLSENQMVEQIDVGGVALLRAAAKNFERVSVLSDPKQYTAVIDYLHNNNGKLDINFRKKLACAALDRTARYDRSISDYLSSQIDEIDAAVSKATLPAMINLNFTKHETLRYGENPHQAASWYQLTSTEPAKLKSIEDLTFPPFVQLQGKELSSNNITDTYALVRILRDLKSPAACIIKHNNPCGVAVASNIEEAYDKAYNTDPLSAFGGVYGFTEIVSGPLASKIAENFIEIVLAPDFDQSALEVFKKKKNVRVLRIKDKGLIQKTRSWSLRDLRDFGFILEQDIEEPVLSSNFKCVTKTKPSSTHDIDFGWSIVKHLTSNAIFIAKSGQSLGFGIGQTSRIASVNHALAQADTAAKGAVLFSDAFFPATDNIESATKAGIATIVQPGGSIKDDDVIKACDDAGIAMLFTGQRCFKH